MEMERLFELEVTAARRCCGTCIHSAPRHGRHNGGAYPLVCLVEACAVPSEPRAGAKFAFPCGIGMDGTGPRGWEER